MALQEHCAATRLWRDTRNSTGNEVSEERVARDSRSVCKQRQGNGLAGTRCSSTPLYSSAKRVNGPTRSCKRQRHRRASLCDLLPPQGSSPEARAAAQQAPGNGSGAAGSPSPGNAQGRAAAGATRRRSQPQTRGDGPCFGAGLAVDCGRNALDKSFLFTSNIIGLR